MQAQTLTEEFELCVLSRDPQVMRVLTLVRDTIGIPLRVRFLLPQQPEGREVSENGWISLVAQARCEHQGSHLWTSGKAFLMLDQDSGAPLALVRGALEQFFEGRCIYVASHQEIENQVRRMGVHLILMKPLAEELVTKVIRKLLEHETGQVLR